MAWVLFVVYLVYAGLVPETLTPTEKSEFFKNLKSYNFTVKDFGYKGLGLVHGQEQQAGNNILCVPQDIHIRHTDPFPFSPYISHLSAQEKLACRVLYEKFQSKKDQFVRHYINTIPTDIPSSLFWSNTTWSLLDRFSLFSNVSKNLDNSKFHSNIQSSLKNLLNLNENVLKVQSIEWALRAVQTRSLKFVGDNKQDILILTPYLDMVNYWPRPIGFDLPSLYAQDDMICIRSPFDRNPGEEVLIDYGTYESSYFFSRYLFNVPNNPYDFISFRHSVDGEEPGRFFKLYAGSINEELLEFLTSSAGQEEKKVFSSFSQQPYRLFFTENPLARPEILSGVKSYRKTFKSNSGLPNIPGIRECRRYVPGNPDEQTVMDFAISSRTTVYNHLRAIDKELLFALNSELLSN